MAIERIPLAQPIESRDGTLLKDSYTSNAVFETRRGKREFVKRPGLINIIQVVATTPPAYVTCNGLTSWNGFLISVIGNTVYKTGYTGFIWATSTLGTMTAGTRAYFSASLLDKYLVVHNGFGINIVTLSSGVLSVPTTPPPGNWVPGIAYLNNAFYVAVGYNNSIYDNRIYNSNPTTGDPNTWNASSYVTFYQTGDTIVGICKHLNYIVVFGNFSTQFFYDNGANQPYPASPLAVAESYTNEIGCADGNSVVATNNTVLWVGTSKAYGKSVYMMDGVSPIKISTNYVDKFLEVVSTGTKGIYAYVYKFGGHTLYVLTLQGSYVTLVYDIDEKEWYNWTQYSLQSNDQPNPGTFQESYFRPTFYAEVVGVPYGMDDDTSTIYKFDTGTYQDDSQSIYCRSVTDLSDNGSTSRKFYGRLEIIGDKTSATMQISHSGNDYVTFSTVRTLDLSANRAQIYQCGADRRRAWKMLCTSNAPLRLECAEIEYQVGE